MKKQIILDEIYKEITLLDEIKIMEVYDFIRFLRFRESIDPTLEIMPNEEDYLNIKKGIEDKKSGRLFDWDSVK